VITGYDYVLFAPAIDIDVVSVPALVELSQRKNLLVPLGVLATTKPVLEPPLAAGSYVVAFAARGMADSGPRTDTFDPDVDHFVFLDLAGTHLATTAVPKIEFMHPPDPTLTLSQDEQSVASVVDGKVSISAEPVTLATLHVSAWVRLSNRGLAFDLPLVFAQGDVGDDWRHP
jgi:hypothetical protein